VTHVHGMGSRRRFWDLLSRDDQRALLVLGRSKTYQAGATICIEGDPATHVFILLGGWVKVLSATGDGHDNVLALRRASDIVGETAGETTGQRNATIRAVRSVHALIVSHVRFSSFLDTHPGANQAYRRILTQRWSDADHELRVRAVTNGAQRLAGVLIDLAEPDGSEADGDVELAPPLSQEDLASLAGTSRATVTRALGNWRGRGFISTSKRRITIMDLAELRRIAGPAARLQPPAAPGP
jgi:CRP/FNR family transcriptional regulator, cyclic AMP receptor protein